jgi:hypothetical protein
MTHHGRQTCLAIFLLFLMDIQKKIWIIGSSLVHWAEHRAHRATGKWNMLPSQKVSWHGQRGMKWNQLLPKMKTLMRSATPPQMLFVHLGGNDLASTPLRQLTQQAQCNMKALSELCPQTVLIWSDVLPRIRYRGADANNKMKKTRKTFNSAMRAYIRKLGGKVIRQQKKGGTCHIYFDRLGCT